MNIFKKIIGDKKAYKEFKAEIKKLPKEYQIAFNSLQSYMWNFWGDDNFQEAFDELLHLFQESSMDNIPIKDIVGDDPVKFADELMSQYSDHLWIIKIQNKLRKEFKQLEK
ncbi:DUF1048 domain-containing protein [Companilactobacillus sp. DQM5]|uniref:DUF1048 domain-containing protein n=1 Tax=Companilactobacillus sp. DQM5 TaxID=3463359 RepID=UPI0040583916